MVAFELAQLEETAGRLERATDWYKRAWLRFRRSEWKQKAEEALTRHGIPIPTDNGEDLAEELTDREGMPLAAAEGASAKPESELRPEREEPVVASAEPEPGPEPSVEPEPEAEPEAEVKAELAPALEREEKAEAEEPAEDAASQTGPRPRRRRGGRGRGKARKEPVAQPVAEESAPAPARSPARAPAPKAKEAEQRPAPERRPAREPARDRVSAIHVYRRGEPALASEIKALEAKLRQLLASHPYPLDQLNEVPASPGVYLVSDLDLTTMYYLEAFGNMRSAMDQLVSGRRGRQGSVRARLARYLGISDSQASRYLKQHCVVRWIELEESDAIALGHFAAALLHPELKEELS